MEKPKRRKNYLNNEDLLKELKKSHERGRPTEELGRMFIALVTRYATIPRFSGYSYNDEMRSFALLTLCKVWKGFNMEKYNNPFAYFTQITHNAFHQLDNSERRQRDIRDALLVDQGKNPSFNYAERYSGQDNDMEDFGDSDYMEYHDKDLKVSEEVEYIVAEIDAAQERIDAATEYANSQESATVEEL